MFPERNGGIVVADHGENQSWTRYAFRRKNEGMKSAEHKSSLGTVSAADRGYIRKLARATKLANRSDGPAGTLAEALDRMWRIERAMGIDVAATALEHWPDCASHMTYLEAVRKMAAKEQLAQDRSVVFAG